MPVWFFLKDTPQLIYKLPVLRGLSITCFGLVYMELSKVLFCKMGLMSERPFLDALVLLLDWVRCNLLILKGRPGALTKAFRFVSTCRPSSVLVRFHSWQKRLSPQLNNFHAYPFKRRKSILEENGFFFFPLSVALRGFLMKRQQRQQIISSTCGFAAKASGRLFSARLTVGLTTSCNWGRHS